MLLTNHGRVLAVVVTSPEATSRHIGMTLGLTERSVLSILADLTLAGLIQPVRRGRRVIKEPIAEHQDMYRALNVVLDFEQSLQIDLVRDGERSASPVPAAAAGSPVA